MRTLQNWLDEQMKDPDFKDLWEEDAPLGWRCPVCGRGLAPDVRECGCVLDKPISNSVDNIEARVRLMLGY